MKKICVIGSINYDLVVNSEKFPVAGETLFGESFKEFYGGKGANQAVAAAKLGSNVTFFGKVGNDTFGSKLLSNFSDYNINIGNIESENTSSGTAVITIAENNNTIIVISGANEKVDINYIQDRKQEILSNDIIICQLEIPLRTVEYIAEICKQNNKIFILNPAPAKKLSEELINNCTYITPNEIEILQITEEVSINKVLEKYPNKMILTNGENGIKYYDGNEIVVVDAADVNVLDTTGAGDTFNGAFAYALSNEMSVKEAVEFANVAAGLSVTKIGAQIGIPSIDEIHEMRTL